MAEISNNMIAALLVLAILVSGFGVLSMVSFEGRRVTGGATSDIGAANVTISGAVAIELNSSRPGTYDEINFDTGTLGGAQREITSESDNYGTFDDGWTGDGSGIGSCDDTEENCAFPLVLINTGNVNASINVTSDKAAATFIGTGASQYIRGRDHESGACGINYTSGAGTWQTLDTNEVEICYSMEYSGSSQDAQDEIQIHLNLTIPSDAEGTKQETITIGATSVS